MHNFSNTNIQKDGKIKWKNHIQLNVLFQTDTQISKFILYRHKRSVDRKRRAHRHILDKKNQHKVTINAGQIGFMYQNITFKQHKEEMYQTNSIDLFSALYHLTYENENDINEILNIKENETIEQVATFERKPNLNANLILTNIQNQKRNSFKCLIFNIHI